jgi:phage baseplate assembly protein W
MSQGLQLSDYNYSPNVSVVARKCQYSDLDLSFKIHPILKDIIPLNDIDAINNSLKNLIASYTYSRPFKPFFNNTIKNLLFEPNTRFTRIGLRDAIGSVIERYEPRVKRFEVDVDDNDETNSYKITIMYETSYDETEQMILYIERLR